MSDWYPIAQTSTVVLCFIPLQIFLGLVGPHGRASLGLALLKESGLVTASIEWSGRDSGWGCGPGWIDCTDTLS